MCGTWYRLMVVIVYSKHYKLGTVTANGHLLSVVMISSENLQEKLYLVNAI